MFFCIFFIKNKSLKSFAFAFDLRLMRGLNSLFCFFARLVLVFVNEIHNKIKTYYKYVEYINNQNIVKLMSNQLCADACHISENNEQNEFKAH